MVQLAATLCWRNTTCTTKSMPIQSLKKTKNQLLEIRTRSKSCRLVLSVHMRVTIRKMAKRKIVQHIHDFMPCEWKLLDNVCHLVPLEKCCRLKRASFSITPLSRAHVGLQMLLHCSDAVATWKRGFGAPAIAVVPLLHKNCCHVKQPSIGAFVSVPTLSFVYVFFVNSSVVMLVVGDKLRIQW